MGLKYLSEISRIVIEINPVNKVIIGLTFPQFPFSNKLSVIRSVYLATIQYIEIKLTTVVKIIRILIIVFISNQFS